MPQESLRDSPTYVVECFACQQPWEVSVDMRSTGEQRIIVPGHMALNRDTSGRGPDPCSGDTLSGVGKGERGSWERQWPLIHGPRPLPELMHGWTVRLSLLRDLPAPGAGEPTPSPLGQPPAPPGGTEGASSRPWRR